jgi:16S rRNA (guanine966-N2)-methyltransferase
VLDLFAGSGALGIEALSRGARSCVFVEKDRAALSALRENVAALKLREEARIVAENAWTVPIRSPTAHGFGLVFVDPPYRDVTRAERVDDLLTALSHNVSEDGVIVLRHGIETPYSPAGLRTLQCVDERRFGSMRILLLARRVNRAQPPDSTLAE